MKIQKRKLKKDKGKNMPITQEFIDSQKRNNKGYILPTKAVNKESQEIEMLIKGLVVDTKAKGFELNKAFYDTITATGNFYKDLSSSGEVNFKELVADLDEIKERIQSGEFAKKATKNEPKDENELLARIEALEKKVARLERTKRSTSKINHDNYLGEDVLPYQLVQDRLNEIKNEWKGKGYTREDFGELYALNKNGLKYENTEALQKAIDELNERIKPDPNRVKKPEISESEQDDYDGEDDAAMDDLRKEAQDFSKENPTQSKRVRG